MHRRQFLIVSSAASLAGLAAPAFARGNVPSATAERVRPDAVKLAWTGASEPVRVLASSDPDAPAALMRVAAEKARGGVFEAGFPARPRPYFLLQFDDMEIRVAERLLPLKGGRNFRDLGGYRAEDGRHVRWGRIYRSGVTAGLTAEDRSYLSALGVRTVFDFRSTRERVLEPAALDPNVEVVTQDYDINYAEMAGILTAKTRAEAIAGFAASYASFAETLAAPLSDLFQRLVRRETPLAFNCAAGKDRTGLAAALVLSALGVPRDTVVADYALSEVYVPVDTYLAAMRGEGAAASAGIGDAERQVFARMPEEVIRVLLGTPAEVMTLTLARMDETHGGPIGFVTKKLGVSAADIETLRATYLV